MSPSIMNEHNWCKPLGYSRVALALLLVSAGASAQHFDIDHFRIEGNSVFPQGDIDAVVKPYTGKQRDYGDVQGAMEALRQRYSQEGYSVVWVVAPEQELDQGVVTLRITEARIGTVSVKGNQHFDEGNIRASLPELREGAAPKLAGISANTQLANENPAKQVAIVLRAGMKPGLVDATVDVSDQAPLRVFLSADNTGSPQTGNARVGIGLQYANLFNRDHVGTLNYVTSPGKENQVRLYSGSYRLPLYSRGDSLDFILGYSDVNAGTTQTVAGPLMFSGRGAFYGLRYNQLLGRRGEVSHRLIYGLDYRAYRNTCALGDFGAAGCGPAAADITVRPVSLTYSGNWAKPGRSSDFYVALSHNLAGGNKGRQQDFEAARPSPNGGSGAPSRYTVLRLGVSLAQSFAHNWQARAAIHAQYSVDALISGEQFGIAGGNAIRGFPERQVARDTGYFARFEVHSPFLMEKLLPPEMKLRGVLFHDFGSAANNPLPGESRQRASIASIGAGLRWSGPRNFSLLLDMARVTRGSEGTQAGELRGHAAAYFEIY